MCRVQLQSIAARPFAPTAAGLSRYQSENQTGLCFSDHMNGGFEDMVELQFFSVHEASGDVRRLIKVTNMLHKPDVCRESCSLSSAGGTPPCLFLFFKYFLLMKSCGALRGKKDNTISHLPPFALILFFFTASSAFIL